MFAVFEQWMIEYGLSDAAARLVASGISIAAMLVVSWLSYVLARHPIHALLFRIARRTSTKLDERIMEAGFLRRLTLMAPGLLMYVVMPVVLPDQPAAVKFLQGALLIYLTIALVFALDALLNGINLWYEELEVSHQVPIKSFLQGLKVVLVTVSFIFVIAIALDKTPLYLFSGLGALTAVMMLIFKDAILGFVAGIQLTANKMVAKGDWISMPQYGADGFVIDVALTTVKVQNWDKTITTIPTYALISESFLNWRGMFASGGRRIMRSINIDMNTIRLCTPEMYARYEKIEHIKEYLARKKAEVKQFNVEHHVAESCRVNGRRLTNVGTFRAYVTAYLRNHPDISREMTFLVRQLQPGEHGLPIEIYVFSKVTSWVEYEGIQADIFDHLLAVAPEFDLRIFQAPSGGDIREAAAALAGHQAR